MPFQANSKNPQHSSRRKSRTAVFTRKVLRLNNLFQHSSTILQKTGFSWLNHLSKLSSFQGQLIRFISRPMLRSLKHLLNLSNLSIKDLLNKPERSRDLSISIRKSTWIVWWNIWQILRFWSSMVRKLLQTSQVLLLRNWNKLRTCWWREALLKIYWWSSRVSDLKLSNPHLT